MRAAGADVQCPPERFVLVGLVALMTMAGGCAAKAGRVTLPEATSGTPSGEVAGEVDTARRACRAVTSLTAEVGVAGRLGRDKVRGRLLVGFDVGGRARLEALAPFGQPIFIMVVDDGRGTLLLPRDRRVVRDVAADDLLVALAGIRADGSDLRALLTGCLVDEDEPSDGQRLGGEWSSAQMGGRATAFLRHVDGAVRLVSGRVAPRGGSDAFLVGYDQFAADGLPRRVRLEGGSGELPVALDLSLSGLDVNQAIGAEAFEVTVPPDTAPLTLAQLRGSSPLAAR